MASRAGFELRIRLGGCLFQFEVKNGSSFGGGLEPLVRLGQLTSGHRCKMISPLAPRVCHLNVTHTATIVESKLSFDGVESSGSCYWDTHRFAIRRLQRGRHDNLCGVRVLFQCSLLSRRSLLVRRARITRLCRRGTDASECSLASSTLRALGSLLAVHPDLRTAVVLRSCKAHDATSASSALGKTCHAPESIEAICRSTEETMKRENGRRWR
jgi:hypothetical protein